MLNGYEWQFVYVYGAVSPLQGALDWMLCGEMNAVRMGEFLDQVSRAHNQDAYSIHGTHSNAWTGLRCTHMIRPTTDDRQSDIAVVVQFCQNLSGQPYVVARSEGRHPSTDSGQAPACPYYIHSPRVSFFPWSFDWTRQQGTRVHSIDVIVRFY
jgi:hypothetical protein